MPKLLADAINDRLLKNTSVRLELLLLGSSSGGTSPNMFGFGSVFSKVQQFDVRFWEENSMIGIREIRSSG